MNGKLPPDATLEQQLTSKRSEIRTDSYQMSVGELVNMYADGEMIISPAFQRLFRWDDHQKSSLVESILLGIPLPSIFVSQDDRGRWELVDGLQRISTILQLRGLLEDREPLQLKGTKYLPGLEGVVWESNDPTCPSLTSAQRLDIKRAKIDVKIILRDSNADAKFDLFQRLNSYGSVLTAQEILNALIVQVNPDFATWLQDLATSPDFVKVVGLSSRDIESKYDEELILRFFWLHNRTDLVAALADFRSNFESAVLDMARDFPTNKARMEKVFRETFSILANGSAEDSFKKWEKDRSAFRNGFSNTAFEGLALGLGFGLANGLEVRKDTIEASKELWGSLSNERNFATGKSTDQRMRRTIPLGRQLMVARSA